MPPKNSQNAGKGWGISELLGIDGTIHHGDLCYLKAYRCQSTSMKKTKIEFGIKQKNLAVSMPPKNPQNAGKGWETSAILGIDGTVRHGDSDKDPLQRFSLYYEGWFESRSSPMPIGSRSNRE